MCRQVLKLHHTALALHEINDSLRNPARVETVLAVRRDSAERVRERRERLHLAGERRLPIEQHLVAAG